jgi:hypothetical protein
MRMSGLTLHPRTRSHSHVSFPLSSPTFTYISPAPIQYDGPIARLAVYISRTLIISSFASIGLWLYTGDLIFKHVYTYFIYFLLAIGVGWEVVLWRDRREMEKGLEGEEREVEGGGVGNQDNGKSEKDGRP